MIKPPSDFIPAELAVKRIEVFVPAPKTDVVRPAVEFVCPQCGATA